MDLETQEYIKNIFMNWAHINKAEIEENVRTHRPYAQQIERIVPNMEQAIYLADIARIEQKRIAEIQAPILGELKEWQ